MNWGRMTYVFLSLMGLTTLIGFIYYQNEMLLFFVASLNAISTLLKIGVRSQLAAELFASSLVADLHLIPAFIIMIMNSHIPAIVVALSIGAVVANVFSLILIVVESAKMKDEF